MIRLVYLVIYFALAVGVCDAGVNLVMDLAKAAAHAHQNDQISYSWWNRALWAK